jgi:2-phosphosulfolactate phosphatase
LDSGTVWYSTYDYYRGLNYERKALAMPSREVHVHLTPALVEPGRLRGADAVAIDVLRATTTIVHALAAGCVAVHPCAEIEEARSLIASMPKRKTLLAGERDGKPIADFDLSNSPREFTAKKCKGKSIVFTTTNGTQAIARALEAERLLIAGFVNFSAVCEQLCSGTRPLHIICAGIDGTPAIEDTLLAGAFIEVLCDELDVHLNDSARIAWDCFENHGRLLLGALQLSQSGEGLTKLGYGADIPIAAAVDKFALVPELRRDPVRIEVASAGIVKERWVK